MRWKYQSNWPMMLMMLEAQRRHERLTSGHLDEDYYCPFCVLANDYCENCPADEIYYEGIEEISCSESGYELLMELDIHWTDVFEVPE